MGDVPTTKRSRASSADEVGDNDSLRELLRKMSEKNREAVEAARKYEKEIFELSVRVFKMARARRKAREGGGDSPTEEMKDVMAHFGGMVEKHDGFYSFACGVNPTKMQIEYMTSEAARLGFVLEDHVVTDVIDASQVPYDLAQDKMRGWLFVVRESN